MGLACFNVNTDKGFFNQKNKVIFDLIHDSIDSSISDYDSKEVVDDEDFYMSVTVFDFLCLSSEYVIEAKSMKFLVQQGFDFNELAKNGISFNSGNDMVGIF